MKLLKYPVHRFASSTGVEYVLVPKCGSNSIRRAINQSQNMKRVPVNFVFTFVRHPLARLISAYTEKIQTGKTDIIMPKWKHVLKTDMSIDAFVDFLVNFDQDRQLMNDHFCPQSWLIRDIHVDFVGCLENITEDWKVLMDKGLPPIKHLHKTDGVPKWKQVLTPTTEAKARAYYKDDFEKWPDWWD